VSWRLGLRLGARELRRSPWRSLLVVVMVLVPAAGMAGGVTLLRTSDWSKADHQRARYGTADLAADLTANTVSDTGYSPPRRAITDADLDQLRAALPEGSIVAHIRSFSDRVTQGDHRASLDLTDLDLRSRMADGRFLWSTGQPARGRDEVVLSTDAARRLHVGVGDTIHPLRLGRPLRVTGLVEPVVRNDTTGFLASLPEAAGVEGDYVQVDLPADAVRLPTVEGWSLTPVEVSHTDHQVGVLWTYLAGGIALIVLSTIIAAAFAVGARRQLRTVGLLSASGAPPRVVTWCLAAQGAITGCIGAALGAAAGVLVTRALPEDLLTELADHRVRTPTTRLLDLVPIVVIGTLVAGVAAWIPARTASRVPVLQALAGRRPLASVPRRLPALAAVSLASGCALLAIAVAGGRGSSSTAWALVGIVGGLGLLGGVLGSAPWVVARLERRGGRWPESWRLAGRSLARSRVRSSAVVAAIATMGAALVAGTTLLASLDHSEPFLPYLRDGQLLVDVAVVAPLPPDRIDPTADPNDPYARLTSLPEAMPDDVRRQLEAVVPGLTAERLSWIVPEGARLDDGSTNVGVAFTPLPGDPQPPDSPPFFGGSLGVATPSLLDLLGATAQMRSDLAAGKAVATFEAPAGSTAVRFTIGDSADATEIELALGQTRELPGAASSLPSVLISPSTADRLHLTAVPSSSTVLVLGRGFTTTERDRLELLAGDLSWQSNIGDTTTVGKQLLNVSVAPAPSRFSDGELKAIALAAVLLLVLLVVGIGLALAAKDSEDEGQILSAIGAPPKVLRRVAAGRAALLAAVAAVLAIPTALLPSASIVAAATTDRYDERHLRPDLVSVAFVLVAVPLAAWVLTAAAAAARDRLRPARPDHFAVDE
jgi:putative ABC transport system permease protein